jgi:CRISPR locus-related DNA-binding protein
MILQIATLGLYDNERIVYAATKRRVDKLVVVSTEKNRDEVEKMRDEFEKSRIPFDTVEVDPRRFKPTLATILAVVTKHPEYEIEFNASCGTRIMASAIHMAASVIGAPLVIVEDAGEGQEYQTTIIGSPDDAILTEGRRTTLAALERMGGHCSSLKDLAEEAGLSRSMITRHKNALLRAGYVASKGSRPISIEITDIGRVVLGVKQLRKKRGWGRDSTSHDVQR